MTVVGTTGLGWLRQLEHLAQATRSAADAAELGRCAAPPLAAGDAGGCVPGGATWGRP